MKLVGVNAAVVEVAAAVELVTAGPIADVDVAVEESVDALSLHAATMRIATTNDEVRIAWRVI